MNPSNDPHIETVRSARQRADFYRVKCDLYRDDPAAVIPLRKIEWTMLDPRVHPFYQHAKREVFVCYQSGKPIGRIAAIVDHLHNQHYGDRLGFFGFFESPNDPGIARLLIETAEQYLREQGCDAIRGPVNPSMKSEFGLLVDGHQHPPRVMMAHTPVYYSRLLEELGFEVVKKFYSFILDLDADQDAMRRFDILNQACARIQRRFPDLRIERATRKNVGDKLREINVIANRVREVGWGFVPLTDAEFEFMIDQMTRIINPELVVTAYYGGQLVGYIVNLPDVNWAIKKTVGRWDWLRMMQIPFWLPKTPQCRVIVIGVDPAWRKKGVSALLTKSMTDLWLRYRRWDFGWVAEDNVASMSTIDRALLLVRYKTYHLYQKGL